MTFTQPTRQVTALTAMLAAGVVLLTGCTSLDESSPMKWTGGDLSDTATDFEVYRATPVAPDLTLSQAMEALLPSALVREPTADEVEAGGAVGEGWEVTLNQGSSGTKVTYVAACAELSADPAVLEDHTSAALAALGDDPQRYSWFTYTSSETQNLRLIGEPTIEGERTWSTGLVTATASDEGLCGLSASMTRFSPLGETVSLDSPKQVFSAAQRDPAQVVPGEYDSVGPTWTLVSNNRVIPAWQFSGGPGETVIAVDLGDGVEVTPDTETHLNSTPN